jgi:hypothetical protein
MDITQFLAAEPQEAVAPGGRGSTAAGYRSGRPVEALRKFFWGQERYCNVEGTDKQKGHFEVSQGALRQLGITAWDFVFWRAISLPQKCRRFPVSTPNTPCKWKPKPRTEKCRNWHTGNR